MLVSPTPVRSSSVPVEGIRRNQRARAPPERYGFEPQPPPDKTPRREPHVDASGIPTGDDGDEKTSRLNSVTEVCEIKIDIDQRDVEVWMIDLLPEKTCLFDLILTNSEQGWNDHNHTTGTRRRVVYKFEEIELRSR